MCLTRHDPTWAWFVLRASDAAPRVVTSVVAPIEPHVRAGIGAGGFGSRTRHGLGGRRGLLLQAMRATLVRGGEPQAGDRIAAEQVLRLLGLDRESAHAIATSALAEHVGCHDGVPHPTTKGGFRPMVNEPVPAELRAAGVRCARDLDVRPLLARGEEPFGNIMHAADALGGDEALHLIALFEPQPLYAVMRKRGCTALTTYQGAAFHVWFYRAAS